MTTNFLETPFTASIERTYRQNGLLPYATLTETFTNKYTKLSGDKLQVRAMKAEDIYDVIGVYKMTTGWAMNLRDAKYDNLLVNGAAYYIAFAYDNYSLWGVSSVGYINSNSRELRNSSNSFSILHNQN